MLLLLNSSIKTIFLDRIGAVIHFAIKLKVISFVDDFVINDLKIRSLSEFHRNNLSPPSLCKLPDHHSSKNMYIIIGI